MSTGNRNRVIKRWAPALLWAAVIFFFSTDHFSAPQTSRILGPLLQWFFPDITPDQVAYAQFAVRKLAHVAEYFILSVLLYRALQSDSHTQHLYRPAVWTMAMVLVWAASDELHQTWVPSRTGSIYDVMIDCFGGLLGTLWMQLRQK